MNQGALGFDGRALLDDQHRHQAVREAEQDGQKWQPAALFARKGGINRGYSGDGGVAE